MTVGRTVPALGLGLAVAVLVGIAAAAITQASEPLVIPITIHYSHFEPARITVPAGRPVTFVITNTDPIDHEWIVGDAASHDRHRTGTEPVHGARPTEISIPAGTERRTTVTFPGPGSQQFICHLPGHEAYGMTGEVAVN
jgi:uncharacterized cupredoxin-like copper-binding protein